MKERKDFDLSRFKDECFPRLSHILQHLLPQGRVRGSEFVCGDLDGSFGDSCSFSLNRETPGVGGEFNGSRMFGDFIDLRRSRGGNIRFYEHQGATKEHPNEYAKRREGGARGA